MGAGAAEVDGRWATLKAAAACVIRSIGSSGNESGEVQSNLTSSGLVPQGHLRWGAGDGLRVQRGARSSAPS
jgi:hypothetical protein